MLVASASASVSPAGAVALAASRFELRMDESICATLEASLINLLKYTTRNYAPKQKEFLQWCAEQPFDPITRQRQSHKQEAASVPTREGDRTSSTRHPAKKQRVEAPAAICDAGVTADTEDSEEEEDDEEDDEEKSSSGGITSKSIAWSTVNRET
ncbi:hypothetical protein CF326_g1361 [Tilletia indica]|nr:hypothetical protein CF326_g1361 [Tilletia indica]